MVICSAQRVAGLQECPFPSAYSSNPRSAVGCLLASYPELFNYDVTRVKIVYHDTSTGKLMLGVFEFDT